MSVGSPIVSVIIPTYNRRELVSRAVSSALGQTYTSLEVIVVDDASTDGTRQVLETFGDSRLRYVVHDVNRGGAASRNSGIAEAKGEYLAFLDSDDEWLPIKIEEQMAVFDRSRRGDLGLVLCGLNMVAGGETTMIEPSLGNHTDAHQSALALHLRPASCSTWLLRRAAFRVPPSFDERFPLKQDREFLVRATAQVGVDWTNVPLATWHGDGDDHISSASLRKRIRALELFVDKFHSELSRERSLSGGYHHQLATLYWRQGNRAAALRHFASASLASPWTVKRHVWLSAALLGEPGMRTARLLIGN